MLSGYASVPIRGRNRKYSPVRVTSPVNPPPRVSADCNIRSLVSSVLSMKHHLTSSKPCLFFPSRDLCVTDCHFYIVSFFFFTYFSSQGGCFAYFRNDGIVPTILNLHNFPRSGLSLYKFICALHLSLILLYKNS